jgi:hypothetical protein
MRPGTYDFEIRVPDGPAFQQRVYVLAGKTTKLQPGFGEDIKNKNKTS